MRGKGTPLEPFSIIPLLQPSFQPITPSLVIHFDPNSPYHSQDSSGRGTLTAAVFRPLFLLILLSPTRDTLAQLGVRCEHSIEIYLFATRQLLSTHFCFASTTTNSKIQHRTDNTRTSTTGRDRPIDRIASLEKTKDEYLLYPTIQYHTTQRE